MSKYISQVEANVWLNSLVEKKIEPSPLIIADNFGIDIKEATELFVNWDAGCGEKK